MKNLTTKMLEDAAIFQVYYEDCYISVEQEFKTPCEAIEYIKNLFDVTYVKTFDVAVFV